MEELEQAEEENPHGFVYAHTLDTFRKSKQEKIEALKKGQDKDAHREKYKKKRDKKKGGDTNSKKLKNMRMFYGTYLTQPAHHPNSPIRQKIH